MKARHRRPAPEWLVGLVIATIVFIVAVIVAHLLGVGDDPTLGALTLPGPAA